jgi:sugar fermentation stimulation protein A
VEFDVPLIQARLLRRYKRFLADVQMPDGRTTTVHCPNTGSMLGCCAPGSRVWLSRSANPKRKYPLTWELVETAPGNLVGINTLRTNQLVREALEAGRIEVPAQWAALRAEVPFPSGEGRVDFRLRGPGGDYYLEVKNVTAAVTQGRALFPDAISLRASRHARALESLRRAGQGAGLLFCAQRRDVEQVRPADEIDPDYGRALRQAAAAGVDLLAFRAAVSETGITLIEPIPVQL